MHQAATAFRRDDFWQIADSVKRLTCKGSMMPHIPRLQDLPGAKVQEACCQNERQHCKDDPPLPLLCSLCQSACFVITIEGLDSVREAQR